MAVNWFNRLRQTDDLSRLVKAASSTSVSLSREEISDLRSLLARERTWRMLAEGKLSEKLNELSGQIAGCLPPRDGRTVEEARDAAWAIARGLLEFAVYDLQPDIFQKVVQIRLQQITGQVTVLDAALVQIHKDLYRLSDEDKGLFRQVMQRLPPEPAGPNEIRVYLRAMIRRLNDDPWLRCRQVGGPVPAPAEIERKLRVRDARSARDGDDDGTAREQDADGLARRCSRLVILGGPGSGKTWLAKRTARICAEKALQAVEGHAALDEVELPLYTTFSELLSAGGDIRTAVVTSALHWIGDLGGSRVVTALEALFTERDAPTLLVMDSLDEARGRDRRLDEIGSLPPAWRIILTSRPSSWEHGVFVEDGNDSHRVGELRPLRYPGDVEAIIRSWFCETPDRGQDLAAQIAQRRGLQEAATVPLILAFYCIIGGNEALPELRHEVFSRVLRLMLAGRWRGGGLSRPRLEVALQTLRSWAMAGADCDPLSGVGRWADEIKTEPLAASGETEEALDHVAMPLAPPDDETWLVRRRFIHRSVQEHLVAEYVADLPVESAAEALLPHLWYDTDWEYAVPAAIAMHDHSDLLLRAMIRRITLSDRIPDDVSVLDGEGEGWEVRRLLSRVAAETREDDWSPEIAALICQARLQLARSYRIDDLAGAWESSNRLAREVLLANLPDAGTVAAAQTATRLAGAVARLNPTVEDRCRARETLLKILGLTSIYETTVGVLVQLAPTAEDKHEARNALLGMLTSERCWLVKPVVSAAVRLAFTVHDKRQVRHALLGLLLHQDADGRMAAGLVGGMVQLAPTARDKRQARDALLRLLARQDDGQVAIGLADCLIQITPTVSDRNRARGVLISLLAAQTGHSVAAELIRRVVQLAPRPLDKRQVRDAFLDLLASQPSDLIAGEIVQGVVELAPAASDKCRVRDAFLDLLASQPGDVLAGQVVSGIVGLGASTPDAHRRRRACEALLALLAGLGDPYGCPWTATLIGGVVYLTPTARERRHARSALVGLLAGKYGYQFAREVLRGLDRLALTAGDRRETRNAMLELLPRQSILISALNLVHGLEMFAPTVLSQRQAREALISLLSRPDDPHNNVYSHLVDEVVWLASTAQDRGQARQALLRLLADEVGDPYRAHLLARGLARLAPTANQRCRARETLLQLLDREADCFRAALLADDLAQLAVTARQKQQASGILVQLLTSGADRWTAKYLAASLIHVEPEAEDRQKALDALIKLLADDSGYSFEGHPAKDFVQLAVTAEDKGYAREVQVRLLTGEDDAWTALRLAEGLSRLAPTIRDRRLARDALLRSLRRHLGSNATGELVDTVVRLAPGSRDKRQAREALLELLADKANDWPGTDWHARQVVTAVIQLAPTTQDKSEAREALARLLAGETEQDVAHEVVAGIVELASTAQDKRQARESLFRRLSDLAEDASWGLEEELLNGVTQLNPTARDLIALTELYFRPAAELLAAARSNSSLPDWLTAMRGDGSHSHLAPGW